MKQIVVLLTLLLIAPPSHAQVSAALSADQILQRVEDGFSGIDDYMVDLDVTVDLERLKVPAMHVTMYFKRPEKVHFETDGFALLPREGMALSTGRLRSRYSIESVRKEILDGTTVQVLTLKSRTDRSKLHDVLLYVDPEHWTASQFVSPLPDGRIMTAAFRYQQVDGHWLPSSMVVRFASAPTDTVDLNIFEQITPTRRPQLPRNGTITVGYSNYRLNTGLSDEIFDRRAIGSGKE